MEKVLLVYSPDQMRGAMVIEATIHENGGGSPFKYYTLDRNHPTQGGKISVGQEDVLVAEFPRCCYASEDASMPERLYAAYNAGGPIERAGLTFDGRAVPTWAELIERAAAGDAGAAGVIAKWKSVDYFSDVLRKG